MAEQNGQGGVVRVATVGDVHCTKTSRGALRTLFERAAEEADVLVLCGDLTDYGLAEEAGSAEARRRAADECACWATTTSSRASRTPSARCSSPRA